METYKNLKKGTKIGLIISMIFVVASTALLLNNIFNGPGKDGPVDQPPMTPGIVDNSTINDDQNSQPSMTQENENLGVEMNGIHKDVIPPVIKSCISLAVCLLAAYYAIYAHKIPHGNLLRILFLAFGSSIILNICLRSGMKMPGVENGELLNIIQGCCDGIGAIIVIYISGRLNKIEKNKYLLTIAGILFFAGSIVPLFGKQFAINGLLENCTIPFMLIALSFAYVARFEEHKTAGLEEK